MSYSPYYETKGGVVSEDDAVSHLTEKLREAADAAYKAAHVFNLHHKTARGEMFRVMGAKLEEAAKNSNEIGTASTRKMQWQ